MTVTQIGRARYPTRPSVETRKARLLDVATVQQGVSWLASASHGTEELWDSYNCMKFQRAAVRCAQTSKTFDAPAVWQSGFYFAVYGGINCKAIGLDQAEMKAEVARVFDTGASTAVEQAFMLQRFANGPDRDPGAGVDRPWLAATDLTPAGGAVKPLLGLALLESHAAANYVGVPTIHMPPSIATLAAGIGAIHWEGETLRTTLGSKVVAGAGYDLPSLSPAGATAATGEKWMYASGEAMVLEGPSDVRQMIATSSNEVYVLAERAYIGAIDCYTSAVRVQETT